MEQAYLFVHFKEKATPDGEQVYFAVSRDGFTWQAINGGQPVLWSFLGEKGVRDMTITTMPDGTSIIVATDLSLAYNLWGKYQGQWPNIVRGGSKQLALWRSNDLVHWGAQEMIAFPDADFGCLWAPDILYMQDRDAYLLHWTSSVSADDFMKQAIYGSVTRDFLHFDPPQLVYEKEEGSVIDSCIYHEGDAYYLFVKSQGDPSGVILLTADDPFGPYAQVPGFTDSLSLANPGQYEAPTAFRLPDGRWCLMLDYFGVPGKGQGYVPFVAPSLASRQFVRADQAFSFPYGFKHGTVLTIPLPTYERICAVTEWPEVARPRA